MTIPQSPAGLLAAQGKGASRRKASRAGCPNAAPCWSSHSQLSAALEASSCYPAGLAILPLTAAGGDGALAATSGTPMPQFMGGVTGGDLGGTGIAGMGGAAGSGSAMGDTGLIPESPADLPWG
jgi:hypothetical protein